MNCPSQALLAPTRPRRTFSLEQANRALCYVGPVVEDICASYHQAVRMQHRLEFPFPDDDPEHLRCQYEQTVATLNRYVDELMQVGVELRDYEHGMVDFPAVSQGRVVMLCWRRGERRINTWHDPESGCMDRRDIATFDEVVVA
jgi:hypothetical protein